MSKKYKKNWIFKSNNSNNNQDDVYIYITNNNNSIKLNKAFSMSKDNRLNSEDFYLKH